MMSDAAIIGRLFQVNLKDRDLELSVCGACLLNNDLIDHVAAQLPGHAWSSPAMAYTFKLICELKEKHGSVDLPLLSSAIRASAEPSSYVEFDAIVAMLSNPTMDHTLDAHLAQLAELSRKRHLARLTVAIVEQLNNGATADAVASFVQQSVDTQASQSGLVLKSGDIWADEYYAGLRARLKLQKVETGFKDLDARMTEGLAPGSMSVIGARAGMGKSAFGANIIRNLSRAGVTSLWLTYEMTAVSQMDRLVALETGLPLSSILQLSGLPDDKQDQIFEAAEVIKTWPIILDDRRTVYWTDVLAAISRAQRDADVRVVFVDLFDKLADFDTPDQARVISRKLQEVRAAAQKFNVHFCLLAQVSRQTVRRESRHPELHDLKGSGGWEENADLALLLHRDKYYNPDSPGADICEVIMAKQRNGPIGTVRMLYDGDRVTFTTLDPATALALSQGAEESQEKQRSGGRRAW